MTESATDESASVAGGEIDWPAELALHDRALRTVVAARLRSRQGVDEVMQEVALAAIRQRSPIADRNRVGAWLYRVAVVQSLLYRRRLGRRRKLVERYADRQQAEPTDRHEPDPLGWLLSEERRALVRRALAALAPRDAEILLLKYTENHSYHQLAALLGISHSAVETRLHRARERLRTQLAAHDLASYPVREGAGGG